MKFFKTLLAVMFLLAVTASCTFAGEIDILVRKLVEKGVLDHGEAQQILTETKEEMRVNVEKATEDSLPLWIQTMKFKGDYRLRYENTEKTSTQTRTRGRFRLRFGFDAKANEKLKIGVRLASGGGEQTSTNQSFDDGFVGKNLYIDRAYLAYTTPIDGVTFIGGKMKNPFFKTSLLWDGDINPEGVAAVGEWQIPDSKSKIYANAAAFVASESSSDSDEPTIIAAQAGLKGKINERKYQAGIAYYDFHNIKGKSISSTFTGKQKDTNTGGGSDVYTYDFNILNLTAKYSPMDVTLFGALLPVTLHADYVTNLADGVSKDSGYQAGIKLGKAKNPGSWEVKYMYQELEDDAVVAELTDSDFHGGGTNAKGHKLGFAYAPMNNSTLGLTYFITEKENGSKSDVDTLQVDWKVKF